MSDQDISPETIKAIKDSLASLVNATKRQNAITLALAIIAASGRPHSIAEALQIVRDINFALHPDPNFAAYQEWAKTKDTRLKKRHE